MVNTVRRLNKKKADPLRDEDGSGGGCLLYPVYRLNCESSSGR